MLTTKTETREKAQDEFKRDISQKVINLTQKISSNAMPKTEIEEKLKSLKQKIEFTYKTM